MASADLFATILEAAGVAILADRDADRDGVSLVPLFRQPEAKLNRPFLAWHYPHYYPTTTPVSAVRSGNWKLLEYHEDMRGSFTISRTIGARNTIWLPIVPSEPKSFVSDCTIGREEVGAQMPSPR